MFLYSVLSVSYLLISIDVTDIFGLCILVGLRAILKLDYRALGREHSYDTLHWNRHSVVTGELQVRQCKAVVP